MARIMIVDDHAVVRMAIRILLEKAGHEVVGEAGDGVEAVRQALQLRPDLVILDIDLPHMDGFRVLRRLCNDSSKFKVLVFTAIDAARYSVRCSRAGAASFVCKTGNMSDLLSTIQVVLSGYTMFPADDLSSVDKSSRFRSEESVIEMLSARELEVLRYLAKGHRVKEVGKMMLLSEKTVSTYKARLMEKLGITNVVEMIELAKRNRLV